MNYTISDIANISLDLDGLIKELNKFNQIKLVQKAQKLLQEGCEVLDEVNCESD